MSSTIHFFRNRSLERIDYEKLICYFDELDNCKIYYNDEMICTDQNFDFPYHFLITKRSRVTSIYTLNPNFYNINLLVEIPILLPEVVSRNILVFVMKLCQMFELEVYYHNGSNGVSDIEPFNMANLMTYIAKERNIYLETHPDIDVYYYDRDKLVEICNYQQMIPYLSTKVNADAIANPYIVLLDTETNEVKLSISYRVDTPMFFPPNLDYVHVEEDDFITIVPANLFMKYNERYMYEPRNFIDKVRVLLLNGRGIRKVKANMRKLRKENVASSRFKEIRIIDLIEK